MASTLSPEEDLLGFLTKEDIKEFILALSIQHLVGVTATEEGLQALQMKAKFTKALLPLLNHENGDIKRNVYRCLVNFTASQQLSLGLLTSEDKSENISLQELYDGVFEKSNILADGMCMLLSNITRSEICAHKVAVWLKDTEQMQSIDMNIDVLCQPDYNTKHATLHHLASVLANLTQITDIRTYLLSNAELFRKLLPLVGFQASVIRRRGAVAAVKNCCFETEWHDWLLGDEVDILPCLLLPLAGPEEFDDEDNEQLPVDLQYLSPDKAREEDPEIRHMLIQAIHQLCATKAGRQYVKSKNAYVIIRELHKAETDSKNDLAIFNLVDILIGDEPADKHANLKEVEVSEELTEKFKTDDETFLNNS